MITPQQCKVVTLLLQGKSNPEIATGIGIALGTVKNYLKQIEARLGLTQHSDRLGKIVLATFLAKNGVRSLEEN
jgi:DNA-binding NarL/FixJ family response regulator